MVIGNPFVIAQPETACAGMKADRDCRKDGRAGLRRLQLHEASEKAPHATPASSGPRAAIQVFVGGWVCRSLLRIFSLEIMFGIRAHEGGKLIFVGHRSAAE